MKDKPVWLRSRRAAREEPPLTREKIVAEAVALLDEEGAAKLTMRRLAQRLDAGSTTLYWHVDTKDDVLDLALDTVFGEVALPEPSGDWRADVRALVTGWRGAMLRHPWSAALVGRPMIGPNVLARTEFLYAALLRGGFSGSALATAAHGLANYVTGSALTLTVANGDDGPLPEGYLDGYPILRDNGHLRAEDWNEIFAQGLESFMDGLASLRA
ncbi:TetR/AcrR family transcriptional regulator [Allokutzneria sp. NRRL B-24872]|uniref:TetR/AcrR family transcriptional regulator n=1 Tax=Allokutzneria sp. NRRL B-24872 TaxID=1137961 RepID=UPI001FEF56C3|nr:TetR/AcrR family transcriptional regulator C-terminal domain-containing protein [Allokutzneria sp. NRRL B-24872]